jgi:iron complex outermembrane receptor protein
VFGRAAARSARRTSRNAFPDLLRSLFSASQDFKLKTQTSHDIEGGFRIKSGRLPDAIEHLQHGPRERDPFHPGAVLQRQSRSDPPLRLGDQRSLRVSDTETAAAGRAWRYTRAVFAKAQFEGNDVPLVSALHRRVPALTWNFWQNYLVFDATVCAPGANAPWTKIEANTKRRIPASANRRSVAERRLTNTSSGR